LPADYELARIGVAGVTGSGRRGPVANLGDVGSAGGSTSPTCESDPAAWVQSLSSAGPEHDRAVNRLNRMLLRIARRKVDRRSRRVRITGPELDDVAQQAAADALLAIIAKVGEFRGETRFTTWVFKFVIFEVSTKIGRHFWRNAGVSLDIEGWQQLLSRFGVDPARDTEWHDLAARSMIKRVLGEETGKIWDVADAA
jgi:RNA polymerase sigma-70 factor (ECF subfamily)